MRCLGSSRRRSADVEGSHRELGSGLSDRLGCDHANRLTEVDDLATREIAAVALTADPKWNLAGQHRSDQDLLDTRIVDALDLILVEFRAGFDQHVVGDRVANVFQCYAAENALADQLDDLAPLDQRACLDSVRRPAVELANNHVLGDVDEAPGQVARIRSLERRVRQALARTVGRNEILKHRETLAEVRGNWRLDDFTRWLGHQTPHPGQLTHLLSGTSGPRVGHHVDGIEARNRLFDSFFIADHLGTEPLQHLARNFLGCIRPDVDHLVVALAVGDQALLVLLLDQPNLLVRGINELLLVLRNLHVVDADRDSRFGGVLVTQSAKAVSQNHRRLVAQSPVCLIDEFTQRLLVHHLIDQFEGNLIGHDLLEQDSTRGRLDQLAVHAYLDRGQ